MLDGREIKIKGNYTHTDTHTPSRQRERHTSELHKKLVVDMVVSAKPGIYKHGLNTAARHAVLRVLLLSLRLLVACLFLPSQTTHKRGETRRKEQKQQEHKRKIGGVFTRRVSLSLSKSVAGYHVTTTYIYISGRRKSRCSFSMWWWESYARPSTFHGERD